MGGVQDRQVGKYARRDLCAAEKAGDQHLPPAAVQALGAFAHHPYEGVLELVLDRAVGLSKLASGRLIHGGVLAGGRRVDRSGSR